MENNSTVTLLQSVSHLEPSFNGYETEVMETSRITSVATAQLKNCDGLDLLTTVWRGRIIAATKMVLDLRNARSVYLTWLKNNDLTEKRAEKLIDIASKADRMLQTEELTLAGIANITRKAFETVAEDMHALTVVAKLAEGGAEVDNSTAKRLLEEQTVAASSVISSDFKQKVTEGVLPISKTAKLVSHLEKLEERDRIWDELRRFGETTFKDSSREITSYVESECDIDGIKYSLEQASALNKFADTACEVENLGDFDLEKLLQEAQAREVVPLVAQITGLLCDLETLTTKIHTKKIKLQNLCDRLFVDTSSGDNNLRKLSARFGYEMKEFVVAIDSEGRQEIRLTTEKITNKDITELPQE